MNSITYFFKGFRTGMRIFSSRITLLVNSALLFFVYIIGVGMSYIFVKFLSKKLLTLHIDKKAKTYWEDLNLKKRPIKEYYRQF